MKDNIKVETLLQKLHINGKKGIKFPIKESDAIKYLNHYDYLLDNSMITQRAYDEKVTDVNSRSLNADLYQDFCDCLSKNKSGMILTLKT